MKKVIIYLLITLFSVSLFMGNSYALDKRNDERANYTIIVFVYENDLATTKEGRDYMKVINNVIDKIKNDEKALIELRDKSKQLFESTSSNSSNRILVSVIGYLNAKANLALYDMGYVERPTAIVSDTSSDTKTNNENSGEDKGDIANINMEELTIKIISDKRASYLNIDSIVDKLNDIPSLKNATYVNYDYNDEGVFDYLRSNNISSLPTVIFSTNEFDTNVDPSMIDDFGNILEPINKTLIVLPNGEYELPIGSTYNPFSVENKVANPKLTEEEYNRIKNYAYYEGSDSAKFTWLEFSDLECPYCRKLHDDRAYNTISSSYPMNYYYVNFPLDIHPDAVVGAEILECLGGDKGASAFFNLLNRSFQDKNVTREYMIREAISLGISEDRLNNCLNSWTFKNKINSGMNEAFSLFGVTGTPTVVIINNYTREYVVVSGAYPLEYFNDAISKIIN